MGRKTLIFIITLFLSFSLFGCSNQDSTVSSASIDKPPSTVSGFTTEKNDSDDPEYSHLKLSVTDSGNEIFIPNPSLGLDYRYGPSMLLNDDGSIDAWFSSPTYITDEFDWVTHRHSDDSGKTWSDEKIVLCPTPNSRDALSICDPDVFFHDGYYYLGYTSTLDKTSNGLCNSIFLARSENPDGPFEKWNGSDWGGNPEPIIYYDGISMGWGIGEPSFVIVDDTLYLYATKDSFSDDFLRIKSTEVYSADISRGDWMKHLKYLGCASIRSDTGEGAEYVYSDCDSWDVAYVEENKMFLAVCTNRRFTKNSCLLYYESTDGINFNRVSELNTNVICGCSNCGLMSDKNGHIKRGDDILIGYAYSGSASSEWGLWSTRIAPLKLESVEQKAGSEDGLENLKLPMSSYKGKKNIWTTGIITDKLIYQLTEGGDAFPIEYSRLNSNYTQSSVPSSEITFSGYDESVVYVSGHEIKPKAAGTTPVTISYQGVSRQICLFVLPEDSAKNYSVTELIAPKDEYNILLVRPYSVAIRPLALLSTSMLVELNSQELSDYGIKIEVEDEEICKVRDDAAIIAYSPGETTIHVSAPSGSEYSIKVKVTE